MSLTPFQKRFFLIGAYATLSVLAQVFPLYHQLIAQAAMLFLGVAIPGPDTNHTVTVRTVVPSVPPSVASGDGEAL